jgi:transposase
LTIFIVKDGSRLLLTNLQLIVAIEQADAQVRFLPPYSTDFNPIELALAKLKAFLRAGSK